MGHLMNPLTMLLFRGGDDMKDLFEYVGAFTDTDTFDATITKIRTSLQDRTNNADCKETGTLQNIYRELHHLYSGQKKSAMPPNL